MRGGGLSGAGRRRGVRSFVSRSGRVTRAQRRALEELWPRYGLELAQAGGEAFGRQAPLMLEIGFGMGDALAAMASARPERNYIGVDVYPPGIGSALLKIRERELDNVRLVRADAVDLLTALEQGSVAGVLAFFPDPWPKKRHRKRRLVQAPFVGLVCDKLESGGRFELATDWEPYAVEMLAVIEASGCFVNLAGSGNFAPGPAERPETKFQRRGEMLGHEIFDLVFMRRGSGH